MNTFLTEAIENVKTYRQAFTELVSKLEAIRKDFGTDATSNYPTFAWIAGKFKQLYNIPQIEKALASGTIENPEKKEEYAKIIALKDVATKYKFITNDGGNYKMTNNGSSFVQYLGTNFQSLKDLKNDFRETNFNENQEWYDKLPTEQKKIVDTYKELSPQDYAYLIGLVNKMKNKESYFDYVNTSAQKDGDKISRLEGLGLLNHDMTLNKKTISSMLDFLNDQTYARLKGFNKSIAYIVDRISADKALLRNALERNIDRTSMRRTDMAEKADGIIDKLDDNDKSVIVSKYKGGNVRGSINKQKYQSMGIMDQSGSLTDLGTYIAVVLTKMDRNASLEKSGEKGTQYSRLNKSDVGGDFNTSTRRNERAGSRSGSFKNFLKQR
jgi:hypothetical protein